ncbi:unnamed protein product [Sphenostylis stenocarpa]|uniref:Uncharacterized protein n=1 Tax=Sphenostylis stenocarpa TaxID=92480 RepID=A0AA86S8W2_9FABA|nr:unnamed protein product [Sphenostylis stenocarpa]
MTEQGNTHRAEARSRSSKVLGFWISIRKSILEAFNGILSNEVRTSNAFVVHLKFKKFISRFESEKLMAIDSQSKNMHSSAGIYSVRFLRRMQMAAVTTV